MPDESSRNTGQTCDGTTTCERGRKRTPSKSISSLVDFPVPTSATQANGPGSPESNQGCGQSSRGSFANYDRESCSWKTWQRCLVEGWIAFSAIWPRAGSMRSGIAFRHRPLVLRTDGTESLLFPTPKASAADRGGRGELLALVRGKKTRQEWPTPRSRMTGAATANRLNDKERNLEKAIAERGDRGPLNPQWVEWLMGFPIGWTDCDASATPSCRKSQSGSEAGSSRD